MDSSTSHSPNCYPPAVKERAAKFPRLLYEYCTRRLYEHCEIHGPERYGAIGEYWDTYRFFARPIDMDSDENRLFDVEGRGAPA